MSGVGPNSEVSLLARHVRCTFKSGRRQAASAGPLRAHIRTLHRNKTRTQPITLSVRASTIGSVEPCYSIRIARRFISANFVNDITYPTGDRM